MRLRQIDPWTLLMVTGLFLACLSGLTTATDLALLRLVARLEGAPERAAAPVVILGDGAAESLVAEARRHGWSEVIVLDGPPVLWEASGSYRLAPSPVESALPISPLSWPCRWVDCGGASWLLVEQPEITVLSAPALAAMAPGQVVAHDPVVVARSERNAREAAGALASARSGGLLRSATRTEVAIGLLVAIILGESLLRRGPRGAKLLLLAAPVLVAWWGLQAQVLWPVTGVGLGLVLGAVGVRLEALEAGSDTGRRLTVAALRTAARTGTLRRRVEDEEALEALLADVTRTQVPGASHGYVEVGREGLRWVGGGGLSREELPADALTTGELALVARTGLPARSGRLVAGLDVAILPLHRGRELVGLWVLASPTPIDLQASVALARAIGERLDAGRMDGDGLERLLAAAEADARHWRAVLQALDVPMVVTDLAGRAELINTPMQQVLDQRGLQRDGLVAAVIGLHNTGQRSNPGWAPGRTLQVRTLQGDEGGGLVAWLAPMGAPVLTARNRSEGPRPQRTLDFEWEESPLNGR